LYSKDNSRQGGDQPPNQRERRQFAIVENAWRLEADHTCSKKFEITAIIPSAISAIVPPPSAPRERRQRLTTQFYFNSAR